MKSFRRAQTGVVVGLMAMVVNVGVVQGVAGAAVSSPANPATVARDAGDTDPHLPLTAQTLRWEAEKFAAATRLMEQARKAWATQPSATQSLVTVQPSATPSLVTITPNFTDPGGGGGTPPSSAAFSQNQQAQQTGYWCGPAAVSEALGQRSYSLSQTSAASQLKTDATGTAWSGIYVSTSPSTGYPVADVMNNRTGSTWYVPISVSSTATSADKTNYRTALVTDVGNAGYPLIGDAWEHPYQDHLIGHPRSYEIYHWFDIYGYANSGADTLYEDSVYGAVSIGWSSSVLSAYSTMPSDTIVGMLGDRGYIW